MSENSRKDRAIRILRTFQVYYLAFVCFLVAYGELFPDMRIGMGRKIENLLVIPLLVAIAFVVLERRLKLRFTWREGLLAAFIAFVALGLVYSPHPDVVWKGLMQVATAAVLYFLLLHAVRSKRDFKLFAGAFIAGGVLTAIVGTVNYFSDGKAATRTWGHYNVFGAFLQMPIAFSLAIVVFYIKQWRVLAVIVPVLVILLLGAYVSQSRGAWLGCAVIVILIGALGGVRGHLIAGLIIVFGLTVFFLSPPERVKEHGFAGLFSISESNFKYRLERNWPTAAQMIGERPLAGYGLNTYRAVCATRRGVEKPDYSKTTDPEERARMHLRYIWKIDDNIHPHNELLQAWTSMGIAGMFFYGAVFVTVLLTYLKLRRLKPEGFSAALGLGVFAWYAGHTAHGIFDSFFFFRHAFAAAAVMFALMFGAYYLKRHEGPSGGSSNADE